MHHLKVSDNRRFFMYEDGSPFFYLGDTAWELFHRCTREDADLYLSDRARKGFNVIQAVALAEKDGLHDPNPYGHVPLIDDDPTRPNEPYWQHVDYVVKQANSLGMFVGMLPTWGDKYNKAWGIGPEIFTPDNARVYGRWIATRYADCDIIWILGGDRMINEHHLLIVRAMAEGIREVVGTSQLITFHPQGGESSSTFVGAEPWLDFNAIQSGHSRDRENYFSIERDYRRLPTRPVIDAEPGYEEHPNHFNPDKGHLDHHDVRKSLYWSVFAGACGYTYGCNSVWQFFEPSRKPYSWARTHWKDALLMPGSSQVRHCRRIMESRPYFLRVPDQSLIKSDVGHGGDHIRATRASDGSYAMIYIPSAQRVMVDLSRISGEKAVAWWFNPRSGEARRIGEMETGDTREFFPPNWDYTGRDWVLVIDDAGRGFREPGR